jgi:CDP-diacylglycerol--serine O-phosphatidyltransferase
MKIRIRNRKLPITLTLLRVLLAPIVMLVILNGDKDVSVFLFILIALIAFFDGFIAKEKKRSQIRSIVDLLADKLLINLSAIALYFTNIIPLWVVLIFLGRDLLTVFGASILLYKDRRREFKPTLIGKFMVFFQIIALIPAVLGTIDWVLMYIAIILTIASAIEWIFRSEFRLVRRTDIDEFKISKLIKFADILTLINVVFGLTAILFAISSKHDLAALMLVIAVVFDYLDGKVAFLTKSNNEFGKELDSLADTISFGVAPAVFGFSLIETPLAIIAFTIFIFSGILRLARYNIMDTKKEYSGMPITLNGLIIPLIYFFNVPFDYYPYIFLVLGMLMISTLRIKKL